MTMDVNTLLTRQMELHTSVRQPPKNADQLAQLYETMRNYHHYFRKLKSLGQELSSDPETVFQCFMYISMGGAVSFDKQHEDGSMPMHQAKVLARSTAIELEPAVRAAIPVKELMVYVGLSKDIRTTLRVKVEDGNDLITAETSVSEALEYLDYICRCSAGDVQRMFAFYMVEDPDTLARMLEESSLGASTCTSTHSGSVGTTVASPLPASSPMDASLSLGTVRDACGLLLLAKVGMGGGSPTQQRRLSADRPSFAPLPSPLTSLLEELAKKAKVAGNPNASARERGKAAHVMLDWLTEMPTEYFAENVEAVLSATGSTLGVLASEKRSALCRMGCNAIALLIQRLSDEPYFVEHGNSLIISSLLSSWTQTLCKGIFVTVSAISTATDYTLRELVLGSHGHIAVVKAVLTALQNGTQTELRRKSLGYLALALVAAVTQTQRVLGQLDMSKVPAPVFASMLVEPAQKYVQVGDSPSRKMARALCAVLRAVGHLTVPITDPKTEKLILMEKAQILPYLDDPRELERVLFETNNFVSSMRPTNSSTSTSSLSMRVSERSHCCSGGGGSIGEHDCNSRALRRCTPKTVLQPSNSHGGMTGSENPMASYPPTRRTPSASSGTPVSIPLGGGSGFGSGAGSGGGGLQQPQQRKANKRPPQLPPIECSDGTSNANTSQLDSRVGSASSNRSGRDIFNTAAALHRPHEEEGEARNSRHASLPYDRHLVLSALHPTGMPHPQPHPHPHTAVTPIAALPYDSTTPGNSSSTMLPLSLRFDGKKNPNTLGTDPAVAAVTPHRLSGSHSHNHSGSSSARHTLSPVRLVRDASRSHSHSYRSVTGAGTDISPVKGGGAPAPRISDSLRRKIEAKQWQQ